MATHDFVYQTFVLYIFIKALVLAPLAWITFMYRWNERKNSQASSASERYSPDYETSMARPAASVEIS